MCITSAHTLTHTTADCAAARTRVRLPDAGASLGSGRSSAAGRALEHGHAECRCGLTARAVVVALVAAHTGVVAARAGREAERRGGGARLHVGAVQRVQQRVEQRLFRPPRERVQLVQHKHHRLVAPARRARAAWGARTPDAGGAASQPARPRAEAGAKPPKEGVRAAGTHVLRSWRPRCRVRVGYGRRTAPAQVLEHVRQEGQVVLVRRAALVLQAERPGRARARLGCGLQPTMRSEPEKPLLERACMLHTCWPWQLFPHAWLTSAQHVHCILDRVLRWHRSPHDGAHMPSF